MNEFLFGVALMLFIFKKQLRIHLLVIAAVLLIVYSKDILMALYWADII